MNNTQHMQIKRRLQYSGNATDEAGLWVVGDGTLNTTTAESYGTGGFYFLLADVPNYLEYANLYEQYKICGIKFQIQYFSQTQYTSSNLTTGDQTSNGVQVMLWTDFDSIDSPAATAAGWKLAFESGRAYPIRYPNVKRNMQKVYFKPAILSDAFQPAAVDQYAISRKATWLKTGNPNIAHYGVKLMLNAQPTIAPIEHRFRYFVTYYVKFRYAKGEVNT